MDTRADRSTGGPITARYAYEKDEPEIFIPIEKARGYIVSSSSKKPQILAFILGLLPGVTTGLITFFILQSCGAN